jgi:hypothetical protein
VWHDISVTREDRNSLNGHKSGLIWFTGLSASGKSTIAHGVEKKLYDMSLMAIMYATVLTAISVLAGKTVKKIYGGLQNSQNSLLMQGFLFLQLLYLPTGRIENIS